MLNSFFCESCLRQRSGASRILFVVLSSFILHGGCKIIRIPASTTDDPESVYLLNWNTSCLSAETKADYLRELYTGDGLWFRVDPQMDCGTSEGIIVVYPSTTQRRWVPWNLLAGTLHSIAAHFYSPEELFAMELEQPKIGPRPSVGMFLLQSPGRQIYKMLVWSLRQAWKHGALRRLRFHALVHHMPDWSPQRWRDMLGEADIFGGLHWCYGPNRFDTQQNPRDNYFHKVFTMLHLARRLDYEYIASFDDDVFIPPSALAYMVDEGPKVLARPGEVLANAGWSYSGSGCGAVAPLLQNGIPSVELWAEAFLDGGHRALLYDCFENAGLTWAHRPFSSEELGPVAVPWDPNTWYTSVREKANNDYKGVHPVRGNRTCMGIAIHLAITNLDKNWHWRDDHGILRDHLRLYPYLCNNAFLMRTDLYGQALERPDLQRSNGADEVPMNLLLNEHELPLCFVAKSYGIHPAYNHHPMREELEQFTLREVMRVIDFGSDELSWIA